ncbi:MAG TPA: AlpA family phage regulatory protein [Rhizomicrobium sp.]|nr:AlpA family phage regulatory protein [Rhizomicrobium sp.]
MNRNTQAPDIVGCEDARPPLRSRDLLSEGQPGGLQTLPVAPVRLICMQEVEQLTSLKRSTLYGLMRDGGFPPQVKITTRRSAWILGEVVSWIEQRRMGGVP